MKYTYLLINLLSILFPVALSFDRKVRFYRKWQYLFPGLFVTGLVFLVWDCIFTKYNVWSFNASYILNSYFFGLPLEEILFFITVPFACVFIYECLDFYIRRDILKNLARPLSLVILAGSLILSACYRHRLYTVIVFLTLAAVLGYAELVRKASLGRFYLAWLVSLLPFYLINGVLTSLPVVIYNDAENMGLRIGTIPFEDHFYLMALLLLNVLWYEHFKIGGHQYADRAA